MKELNPFRYLRRNFGAKVFSYVMVSIILIFGSMNYVSVRMQETLIKKHITEVGLLMANILSHSIRLGVFSENETQVASSVEGIIMHQGVIGVCVMTSEGTSLYSHVAGNSAIKAESCFGSDNDRRSLVDFITTQDSSPYFKESGTAFSFWSTVTSSVQTRSGDALFFESESPSDNRTQVIGAVGIFFEKAILEKGISDLKKRNLLIGLIFLAIAVIITYLIVREVTAPLTDLIKRVKKSGIDIPARSEGEVDVLSDTFSNMIRILEESFRTINDLKTGLEKKVEDRTRDLKRHSIHLEETNRQLKETLEKLKETQSQLVHSEKMAALGQLVAGVAHEINNTTNFISGALPPLTRMIDDLKKIIVLIEQIITDDHERSFDDQVRDMKNLSKECRLDKLPKALDTILANISEGTRRTSKIVQDLKTFSRPEQKTPIFADIHENIESTLTLLFHEYKSGVEITKEFAANIPKIKCFPSQLNQVFLNIVLNSIQAISRKGRILIKTWRVEENIHILFKDNGMGMSKDVLSRIFDPFFTTKEVGQGTGLGLSISYGIIKKHKGEILVRSEENNGTEFELILPIDGKIDIVSDLPASVIPENININKSMNM